MDGWPLAIRVAYRLLPELGGRTWRTTRCHRLRRSVKCLRHRQQEAQLGSSEARPSGWSVVAVFRDEGISGAKGRQQATTFLRCQTNALHLQRRRPRPAWMRCSGREFDFVEAWSACRLGRSLPDLIALLGELQAPETYEFWGQRESPVGLSRLSATV